LPLHFSKPNTSASPAAPRYFLPRICWHQNSFHQARTLKSLASILLIPFFNWKDQPYISIAFGILQKEGSFQEG
jgi:hypothetical protein